MCNRLVRCSAGAWLAVVVLVNAAPAAARQILSTEEEAQEPEEEAPPPRPRAVTPAPARRAAPALPPDETEDEISRRARPAPAPVERAPEPVRRARPAPKEPEPEPAPRRAPEPEVVPELRAGTARTSVVLDPMPLRPDLRTLIGGWVWGGFGAFLVGAWGALAGGLFLLPILAISGASVGLLLGSPGALQRGSVLYLTRTSGPLYALFGALGGALAGGILGVAAGGIQGALWGSLLLGLMGVFLDSLKRVYEPPGKTPGPDAMFSHYFGGLAGE